MSTTEEQPTTTEETLLEGYDTTNVVLFSDPARKFETSEPVTEEELIKTPFEYAIAIMQATDLTYKEAITDVYNSLLDAMDWYAEAGQSEDFMEALKEADRVKLELIALGVKVND